MRPPPLVPEHRSQLGLRQRQLAPVWQALNLGSPTRALMAVSSCCRSSWNAGDSKAKCSAVSSGQSSQKAHAGLVLVRFELVRATGANPRPEQQFELGPCVQGGLQELGEVVGELSHSLSARAC